MGPTSTVETSSRRILDIAIVGGGIAGLMAAIGLLKHNIKPTIYESAHHFGEIGAGVAFGTNAVRSMAMIDPAIKEAFEHVATTNQWQSKHDNYFELRYGLDGGIQGQGGSAFHEVKSREGQGMVHRAHFLDELIKLVPAEIAHFGKRLVSIEDLAELGVRLVFKDGTSATHDAVIGCDGIHSETRKHLLGVDNPASYAHWSGKYCHRGLIPMEEAIAIIGEERAMNNQIYMGRGGHVLCFPVDKGKTMNGKSFYPREKFTNLTADIVVAFQSQDTWDDPNLVVPSSKERLADEYKDWCDPVKNILAHMQKPDIWALFDMRDHPADTYFAGRVCVIGDAAHATTPHQGSGAGMAIEDACVLTKLLGDVQSKDQIETAFKAYDAVRRARTQKLVATSRECGLLWEMELEGVGSDVKKIAQNADERFKWIWDEDLEKEVVNGKRIMSESA
ncbi:MAG: hypothetical protein Q9165_004851 [Trypethelium subeluteriae]